MRKFVFIFLFLLSTSYYLLATTSVFAQAVNTQAVEGDATLGVAHMIEVQDKNIPDGSVVSTGTKGAVLSNSPYDPQVLGVVSRDAGIILSSTDEPNALPVISEGAVYLLVSSQQGNIQKGDIITTSTIPGVAVKAQQSGYVLGNALEEYSNSDPKKTGKIAVDLSLHYFNSKTTFAGTLSDIFKIALLPTKNSPSPIFKSIVAAMVVLGSFILGFLTFGRTAAKGVEALGRNPAASAVIHLGIIINVILVVAIILAGLGVSFLILRL